MPRRTAGILHEGSIDKRVQYSIEGLFAVRKSGFVDFPAVPEALDLVEKVGRRARECVYVLWGRCHALVLGVVAQRKGHHHHRGTLTLT